MKRTSQIVLSSLVVAASSSVGIGSDELWAQTAFTVSREYPEAKQLYRIDLRELSMLPIGPIGIDLHGIPALDWVPGGPVFALCSGGGPVPSGLCALDPETGQGDYLGDLELDQPSGIAIGPANRLWVSELSALHEIDPLTGTTLTTLPLDMPARILAASQDLLLGISYDYPATTLWSIDTATGEMTILIHSST